MTPCGICGGAGVVERDTKLLECECSELRRIAAAMPAFIRVAPVLDGHIKALLPDKKTRIIDAIGKSLYITAFQSDMRAFIKLMMIKYNNKFIRITSDREIRDVYVGSTSQKARGEFSKEPVYNNIEDLVKSPNLLLIRLGELKSKNKAAAGALEEAICYRLDRNLPIWLISDKNDPFGTWSHAYSEAVSAITQALTRVVQDQISPSVTMSAINGSLANSPLAPELAPSRPVASPPTQKFRKSVQSAPDDDENLGGLSAFGKGIKPGKKF